MLPSLIAKDIQEGLRQFLTTGFEASDDFMSGIVSRFVQDPSGWLKGPYLQLGLPFTQGASGKNFFKDFETQFPGFSHQEGAWQRLSTNHAALSTLVATGTGSGKTECFVYPVLDHCARAQKSGESGIKALVIYPMNALASDQARRFAELVSTVPSFNSLRVGLYVGGNALGNGQGTVMTSTSVITDRDTLRKNPPDILLTNYKMLDYLMLRPKDRTLWDRNKPETLRYVVVDELHTFDGAQGTDLALLLRRLRARLKSPEGHLICAGTSATLGGASDTFPLRDYARQVFGVSFEPESVITESRQSVGVFLEESTVDFVFSPLKNPDKALDASQFTKPEEAIKAWYSVFFPDMPEPADVAELAWRIQLGEQLKKHQIFVNMLKLVKGQAVHYEDLKQQLKNGLPLVTQPWVGEILDALLVLVAWARVPGGSSGRPLLNLRVQMWMRELRRMVANLAVQPKDVKLRSSADVPANPDGVYLPLIQCTACRTTGWLSRMVQSSSRLSTKLDEIYNTWFASRPEVTRFYAASSFKRPQVEGVIQQVCTACGNLQSNGAIACVACSEESLLPIFRVTEQKTISRGEVQLTRHDDTCPACGERDRLMLVGARNATLGAQVVEHLWASPFNDDKKLIAFSDSVQDAAHRAGFFGARTYQNNVRMALSKLIDEVVPTSQTWSEFLEHMTQSFDKQGSVLHMEPERFVSEFIGPNMIWHPHWAVELLQKGALPLGSRLPDLVRKRMLWQAVSEMTYLSHRGRTLERIGKASLSVPMEAIQPLAEILLPIFQEKYGLKQLKTSTLKQWLWGALAQMRKRGAVLHEGMEKYAEDGNVFGLSQIPGRKEWMPSMSPYTPFPVFVTLGRHKEFDKVKGDRKSTWFERWAEAVFVSQGNLMRPGLGADLFSEAADLMVRENILIATESHLGVSLALNPSALILTTNVKWLSTPQGKRLLTVATADAEHLMGMPCLESTDEHYESITDADTWLARRYSQGDLRRVIAAEHTGLLQRQEREELEIRFKSKAPKPWYENLLSATPTLEMGVDIGDLSSVLLCSVPPNQASYLQRMGRAGRRDGNALTTTLADGASPHDLYFFEETQEMMSGDVAPPGVFLQAAEVLRRQLFAYCMDDWVSGIQSISALPEKTSVALDAVEAANQEKFPYNLASHVLSQEQRLIDGFLGLLGNDIDKIVSDRLRDYMQGQGDKDGMRTRLLKSLEDLVGERKSYRKRKDQVDGVIRIVKQKPQDDATREELDNLSRERSKLIELIAEINGRDLLATLTDVGLIPNYAFPEAGIELKSILWRKKTEGEQVQGNYVVLDTLKYERPANSALSEFAPENRFYANQRRVEIDQINMSLASTESWRFCPACQHMQNLELSQDTEPVCPNCGDAMWGDAAQKRTLLRFKQAIANSDDTKVRIDDSVEEREPKIYVRQLLADFEPKDIQVAWQIDKSGGLPFGFEFVSKVTFRDVNFGELSKPGDSFKVADKESGRPGFKLCKYCGKVQKPQRRQTDPIGQTHSYDCPQHGSEDSDNLLECLYLYREFESEALRILVPYTRSGVDEVVVQSFMAALQLGLKKRFGGKVDHLRMVVQDEPGKEGGPRRHFVMLYDSVPGGTGYLHQLLAQEAGTLSDVLRMALVSVKTCSCNNDPDKDGCYRCVYQYRLGRNMQLVSRDRAAEVLTELVDSLHQLVQVSSIAEIYINPNFDSVLEARFIESLKRMSGVGGLPRIKLVQDIVSGKSGFVIEVGTQRYKIEPQRNQGPSDGVSVSSKPDFVIWPWQSGTPRRPVAVFCDGWQYHQKTLREDANKRSALVMSGKFWVWSVTHNDVKAALDGNTQTDLDSPTATLYRHDGSKAQAKVPRPVGGAFSTHAVAQLLSFLGAPPGTGTVDDGLASFQRNVMWLNFLMVPDTQDEKTFVEGKMATLLAQLPLEMHSPKPSHAPVLSKGDAAPTVLSWWPLSYAAGKRDGLYAPGVVLLEDVNVDDLNTLNTNWRKWLSLYNQQQMLPGMLLATRSAMDAGDCAGWNAASSNTNAPGVANVDQFMLAKEWSDAIDQVMEPLRKGLCVLAQSQAPVPLIGHELANDRNQVIAEAEMAWPDQRLTLLIADQEDMAHAWTQAGWTVLLLSSDYMLVSEMPWIDAVALKLNLNTSVKGQLS
jgi:DEAD/DEAH box helicase domain-containing protein